MQKHLSCTTDITYSLFLLHPETYKGFHEGRQEQQALSAAGSSGWEKRGGRFFTHPTSLVIINHKWSSGHWGVWLGSTEGCGTVISLQRNLSLLWLWLHHLFATPILLHNLLNFHDINYAPLQELECTYWGFHNFRSWATVGQEAIPLFDFVCKLFCELSVGKWCINLIGPHYLFQ